MGKLLLTCSIVILFILLQTEEIVSRIIRGSSYIRKPSLPSIYFHNPSKTSNRPYKHSYQTFKLAEIPEIRRAPNPPENWRAFNPFQNRPGSLLWQNVPPPPDNPVNLESTQKIQDILHDIWSTYKILDISHTNPAKSSGAPNPPENWHEFDPFQNGSENLLWQNVPPPPDNPVNLESTQKNQDIFEDIWSTLKIPDISHTNPAKSSGAPNPPENWREFNPFQNGPGSPLWQNVPSPPDNPVNQGNLLLPKPANPNPVNTSKPGHVSPYPGNPQNSGYPWKPKPPKLKHVAGAAIAGYVLGRAMSNLHFQFNNSNEERWWYENRHRYSDHVYYPQYIQPVPQDIFVRDCVNITVKEYIEPTGNTTEDEMEATVVKHVVKEMCIEQYRTFSRSSEGGSSRPHDGNPVDSKPKGDEVKYVVGKPVVDAPVEDPESYILGSPIAKMHFRFNDSEEERWWNEHRHRFATHVYHPNFSQPISRDAFLSECVNVTVAEYVKPTGNQSEDELEARVVTQVANEKCVEMYPRLTVLTMAGSYYNNKPDTATTLEIKSEFRYGEEAAWAKSTGGASGHNPQKNAVSDLHFSFENALFIIHPFAISVITLITPFLLF